MTIKVACAYPTFAGSFNKFFPGLKTLATPEDAVNYDLVILTGGEDVNPSRYGETNNVLACQHNDKRDEFELRVVSICQEKGIKLFGSCRGLQVINVALGGTLVVDLPSAGRRHPGGHPLKWLRETNKLATLFPGEVNSMHHQGISRLGSKLSTVASFSEVPEIIIGVNIIATQFHPEWMSDSTKFFEYLKEWVTYKRESSAPATATA